ncbi:putative Phage portal protein, lambda family [Magnetospirillum sp. XM-1]|uniref:phage portal protein n=1 Tax=Magnetospirillum sp. XM-1 TaxID=1663591 RepID=UPI00073DC4F4|nr:phage portal protein [Magnetospirillum sp. XM-1]CUW39681.1 putative Phage portal protein, lambda family [Magnetospirillum sp. XM-1]
MGWIDRLLGRDRASAKPAKRPMGRNFAAAQNSRLTNDWPTSGLALDVYLRQGLKAMRSRSRQLARDNDYMRQFLRMVRRNVVGPSGIGLQVRAKEPNGTLDVAANAAIEAEFAKWAKKGNCTVCGRFSWLAVQQLVATAVARDGEILVRKVRGFPNRWGFALQLIEADHLDEQLNREFDDGSAIRMGVEVDKWARPVAYHIRKRHPGRSGDAGYVPGQTHERVPAAEILHLYVPEYPGSGQTRAAPWGHSAMMRLQMLGGYEEAALVAARVGAAKMGFFVEQEGAAYGPGETDSLGNMISDAEAGHFERLPAGVDFREFNPNYPSGEMPYFLKAMLRGACSGLGVSYNGLANDLENVNFSSLRAGTLEERDEWMTLQEWLIEDLHDGVFAAWLEMSLLGGALTLPFAKFDKFNAPVWNPRRWAWVDPEKEINAYAKGVGLRVISRREIAAAQGRDLDEVFDALAAEEKLAKEKGIVLGDPAAIAGQQSQQQPQQTSS